MDIMESAKAAKAASIRLAATGAETKARALKAVGDALDSNRETIFEANEKDLALSRENKLAAPLLKRLKFDGKKLAGVIDGIESLIKLDEPVGRTISARELDTGLELYQVTCPIGVTGVIFESRPDALVQISTLCLKSGNSVLLKGGSEAANTNRVLAEIIKDASEAEGIPEGWLQLLETRSDVMEMLKMDEIIDLVIPRGSNEFVRFIMDNSNIPVMGHADGICHLYIDRDADLKMASDITVDSKCQYVAVCNAVETLLVHESIAADFLPLVCSALSEKGVEIRGCPETLRIVDVKPATEKDWRTEYLDLIISIKVVKDTDEAIAHINRYGSGHTDSIVTTDESVAADFMDLVDSGNVFWNCSTRFSDGYRYGLGAEVGISTGKIHARGPVGLDGLIIYKWKLKGTGQVVADYADGARTFTHKDL